MSRMSHLEPVTRHGTTRRCTICSNKFEPPTGSTWVCRRCLTLEVCQCDRPMTWTDDLGERCFRCGRDLPDANAGTRAGDPNLATTHKGVLANFRGGDE